MPPVPLAVIGFSAAMALKVLTEMAGAADAAGTWPAIAVTRAASETAAQPAVAAFAGSLISCSFPFRLPRLCEPGRPGRPPISGCGPPTWHLGKPTGTRPEKAKLATSGETKVRPLL